jgi:hypothetical protein
MEGDHPWGRGVSFVVGSLSRIIEWEKGRKLVGERDAVRPASVWVSRAGVRRIRVTFRGDIPTSKNGGKERRRRCGPPVQR